MTNRLTESRQALDHALVKASRLLREQRPDDVVAAVERWRAAA
jgi:hypothetical protein